MLVITGCTAHLTGLLFVKVCLWMFNSHLDHIFIKQEVQTWHIPISWKLKNLWSRFFPSKIT